MPDERRTVVKAIEIRDDNIKSSYVVYNKHDETDDSHLLILELKIKHDEVRSNLTINQQEMEEALEIIKEHKMKLLLGVENGS